MTESKINIHIQLREGDRESVLIDSDQGVESIVKALSSSTRREIISILKQENASISKIARLTSMTDSNISAQIKILEGSGLVTCDYESGAHGVKKVCGLKYDSLTISF